MFKAEFELEAITPIFMRGADQTKAEIRSSSIKGLMRWWFRALAGNYFGNDVVNLRKAEESIFGSTGRRSRVVVEISDVIGVKKCVLFKRGVIDRRSPTNQLRYLWFSINLLARKNQFDEYYPAGTKFRLKIKATDEKSFKIALASLWALVTLGGIGFRSRRGAGSVRFCAGDLKEFNDLYLKTEFKNCEDLKNSIERVIELIGEELGKPKLDLDSVNYPVLNPKTSVVALWDSGKEDPIQALAQFQRKYQYFRRNGVSKPERIVFGLPVNLGGKGVKSIRRNLSKIRNSRRASPLIIGLIPIGGKLYIKIVKFKTEQYHPDLDVNELADWSVIGQFNEYLGDMVVFGSLEVLS